MSRGRPESVPGLRGLVLPSLATALLLAAAMPGRFGWWPLLFAALVPLLYISCSRNPGQSMRAGILAGFVYYVCLLYWIIIVLGHYGGLPLWNSLPALLLLSLYMSLYTGFFAALLSYVVRRQAHTVNAVAVAVFAAPLLWVGLDWLRSFLLSGFPWMDLGYGLSAVPQLIQVADLGGHYLLTFMLVMMNCLVLYGILAFRAKKGVPGKALVMPAVAVFFILLAGGYSFLRFEQLQDVIDNAPRARIAVVQGNIPQDEKWTPGRKQSTLEIYRQLTAKVIADEKPGLVIWPETALPFYPENDPLFEDVTGLAKEKNLWLLTGAPRFSFAPDRPGPSPYTIEYYNSVLLISPEGKVRGQYDKQHLVPFGEYVPLKNFLSFLEPLVESVGNFTAGRSGDPLRVGDVRAGILICYESIFPDLARERVDLGANILVNVTNDAWYGRSSAPYQSFAMSVLRAVETRRSLVRAANTGISGFVSPRGEVAAQSPLFEPYVLAAEIPMLETRTLFVRFGYLFAPACLVLSLLMVVWGRLGKVTKSPSS